MICRLIIAAFVLVGCQQERSSPASAEPAPQAQNEQAEEPCCNRAIDPKIREEAQQLLKELEKTTAELEKKLEDAVRRAREERGEPASTIKIPKRVDPKPPWNGLECSLNGVKFVSVMLTVDDDGKTVQVDIKTSSGHEPCDQAVKQMFEATRWEPCDPNTSDLTCTFEYHLGFSAPHYALIDDGS